MSANIEKIIHLRKAANLTITKVAKLLDKARSTVSDWENRKRLPAKTDLIALAQLYDCRLSEISDYDDLPSQSSIIDENIFAANATHELLEIIDRYQEFSPSALKSLQYVLHENRRLETVNRSLQKNKKRLTSIFNAINEILYIKDRKRILRVVNNKFLEQLPPGHTAEDIIGLQTIDLFGLRDISGIIPLENSVFDTGKRIIDEKINIPGGTGEQHGLICIEPIYGNYDEVTEIAVSIKDITGIVDSLERLKLLESIIDNIDEVIWIELPHKGRYEYISEGIERLCGYKADEIRTNPSLWRSILDKKDLEVLGLDRDSLYLNPGTYKIRVHHKNGRKKLIELNIHQSKTRSGRTFYYGINKDISG
ncbi:PAS domain S-box protein [Lentisphaerota bacterium ZTH]|nr:PAS domain S-box protein [Lentisphaerota bacterium]WET06092.1 PAS domain S-box protein [Lentisphaerota bacterium ZTH]